MVQKVMGNIAKQVDLFLSRAEVSEKRDRLQGIICRYFDNEAIYKQVIFKRGSFYFYNRGCFDFSEITSEPDNDSPIYIFDGVKVTKVNPSTYLGSTAKGDYRGGLEVEFGYETNSNNNNNNNNNGNNNGS